jgi:divalent metal cation (Fe/Co/Zn/Cd) transporter
VDSLTAFVALVTICASRFLTNALWLDPVGGLVISAMIVQAGWVNTKTAFFELADVTIDSEIKGKVQKAANLALQEQDLADVDIRGVQGTKSGQNILVEIEVAAPGDWPIARIEEVEQVIRQKVAAKVRGVRRVAVHFGSVGREEPAFSNEFIARKTSDSEPEVSDHNDHEHEHEHEHEHDNSEHKHANGNPIGSTTGIDRSTHKHR